MPGGRGLIDKDTPEEARTKISYVDGSTLKLVFSDEFNVEGRTFYPGDDPYWEAVDLHYWQVGIWITSSSYLLTFFRLVTWNGMILQLSRLAMGHSRLH